MYLHFALCEDFEDNVVLAHRPESLYNIVPFGNLPFGDVGKDAARLEDLVEPLLHAFAPRDHLRNETD